MNGERELTAYRANGEVVCTICGKTYKKHPLYKEALFNDSPFLNVLCNGDLVHL